MLHTSCYPRIIIGTELDVLEEYLKRKHIKYNRIDETNETKFNRHQVIVYDEKGNRLCDAICHYGSYGYEEGLLEIYGVLVDEQKDGDTIVGWLSAYDVIARLNKWLQNERMK